MRLYRIDRKSRPGSRWAGTQADARIIAKEEGAGWDTVEVPTDKAGLLGFLNFEGQVAAETDNLNRQLVPEGFMSFEQIDHDPRYNNPAPKAASGYAEKSLRFEDEFAAMPLATQLHYAALAMENARDAIPDAAPRPSETALSPAV